MRFKKLSGEPIAWDAEDPPAHKINPDYKQQPSNPRQCKVCGKWHDLIVECQKTGARLEELDKCRECFFATAFTYHPPESSRLQNDTD